MNACSPRFWDLFFEVYEHLPRQGPGNRACAARALRLCDDLPQAPTILDLGCGVGGQSLQLAELTSGTITAIDNHAPSIERLKFYTPMEARIAELRDQYANDAEATAILDQLAEEPELHRRHAEFYAYEFFVARRPLADPPTPPESV